MYQRSLRCAGTHGQTFSFQTMTKKRARALENRKFEQANGTSALGCRGKRHQWIDRVPT